MGVLLRRLACAQLAAALSLTPDMGRAHACPQPPEAAVQVARMLDEVTARRRQARLPPLAADPRLDQAAALVACDNARQNRLSHSTADGSTLGSRLRDLGYGFRAANENLTTGHRDAGGAVQGWMASPPHRANILSGEMRQFGGAMVRGASGRVHWAMVSARPR
jgi:uncharacterized protein YkwD